MTNYRYLFLGGGMVAGYAAKEFVERGVKPGELGIVSADSALPYERPPLSKSFLAGKDTPESVLISPQSFYRDSGVGMHLNTAVDRVDLARKRVIAGGAEFGFEHLIAATGARVRKLDVPGATLDGVLYLRSLGDSSRLRERLKPGGRAVVIGGGFIGMEVASQAAQLGVDTTMVFPRQTMGGRLFTPEIAGFFRRYYESRGVHFIPGASVTAIEGTGHVEGVSLSTGQRLAAGLVVAGIGVTPETSLFQGTAVKIDNGIVVDECLETGAPGVMAAGDVANYPDTLFDKRRRVEHWDNAVKQGQYAARRLTGAGEPFVNVPYFFSDIFDLSYEYWGDAEGADRVVHRGNLNEPSFSAWWLRGDRLLAAFVMSRPDEERELAPQWIEKRTAVSAEKLAQSGRPLGE